MNLNALMGMSLIGTLIYFVFFKGAERSDLFFDHSALLLVCGGTIAIFLMTFTRKQMQSIGSLFIHGWLFKRRYKPEEIVKTIIIDCEYYSNGNRTFTAIGRQLHPFLQEGYLLISEGLLKPEDIKIVLQKRKAYFKKRYLADAKALSSLAKYPPALGLLGATHGMIVMMCSFGTGGKEKIGLGMATALVATLWGIGVANLMILPLADYAERLVDEDQRIRGLIAEGVALMANKVPASAVLEHLNSLLSVHSRLKLVKSAESKLLGKKAA